MFLINVNSCVSLVLHKSSSQLCDSACMAQVIKLTLIEANVKFCDDGIGASFSVCSFC